MLGKDKVLCRTNSVQNKHSLYCKRIFLCMCIRGPAKSHMTFDLQTILVQDQTFHLFNHAQKVTQLLAWICAFNHIFVLYEDLRTCCLNVSSLGGSLTKVESLTVANFTRNLFRSIWHHFNFPFGSYSLDISFRLRSTELSMSEHSIREKSLNWLGVSYRAFNITFFPILKNKEVTVSHPVRA